MIGTIIIYINCRQEDQHLIEKFGNDYVAYMQKVPRMNLILGVIRLISKKKDNKES